MLLIFTIGLDEKDTKEIKDIYLEYRTLMKAVVTFPRTWGQISD